MAIVGGTSAFALPTVILSVDQGTTWPVLNSSGSSILGSWRVNASAFSTSGASDKLPEIGFTSFDATSRLPGTLLVRLYDTGFDWGDQSGYYLSDVDGSVTGGSRLSVKTYIDPANAAFNTKAISGDLLTSQGNFFAGALTDVALNSTYGIPSGPFSM